MTPCGLHSRYASAHSVRMSARTRTHDADVTSPFSCYWLLGATHIIYISPQCVQVSIADVPDYIDVIAKPMDYSTVERKLQDDAYTTGGPIAFAADMRLIFTNALAYNWDTEQQCHLDAKQVCCALHP